jgi:hypothetical protein
VRLVYLRRKTVGNLADSAGRGDRNEKTPQVKLAWASVIQI